MRVLFLKTARIVEMRSRERYSFLNMINFVKMGSEVVVWFLKEFVEIDGRLYN